MPIYIARFGDVGPVKIGFSADVYRRLDALQAKLWGELHLLRLLDGTEDDERALHRRFSHLNIKNEWFHHSDEMMGPLGLRDLRSDPTRALTTCHFTRDCVQAERSAALRAWMIRKNYFEHDLAAVLDVACSSVEKWLGLGCFPAKKTAARLVELSNGELRGAYGTIPPRIRFQSAQRAAA